VVVNIRELVESRKGSDKGARAIGQVRGRWKDHDPTWIPGEELERLVDRPTKLKDVAKAWLLAHSCTYPGRMVPKFNRRQEGQLKRFVDTMPGEDKLRGAVAAVVVALSDWPGFVDRAGKMAGARARPGMPEVGFLLRFAHVAADMAFAPTPEKDAPRERIRRPDLA
jgi:hypothetical protein